MASVAFSQIGFTTKRTRGLTAPKACPDIQLFEELFTTSCDWKVASMGWMYTLFFVVIGAHRRARNGIVAREVNSIAVYGQEEGFAVYELVGLAGEVDAERQHACWISRYEQGLAKYRNRNFSGAILDFRAVLDDRHHDRPSEVMLDRCKQLQQLAALRSGARSLL